jgi:hypothetical protein
MTRQQLTYRAYSVYDANYECDVLRTEYELTEDIDLTGDWKTRAHAIQVQLHSLLGDVQYLEDLKRETRSYQEVLRQLLNVIERGAKSYEESRAFMVAQGLGSKMPDYPFDPSVLTKGLEEAKKLLMPGSSDYDC